MSEIVDYYPEACGGCGREFCEDEKAPCGRFGCYQVAGLPLIAVIFFEYRMHRLRCPGCGKRITARLREGVEAPCLERACRLPS